jgi:hypothetical protein
VTGAGAVAGEAGAAAAGPFAGAEFDATSVCAHVPAVSATSVRVVKSKFVLSFMEVQSSPFGFVLALLLRGGYSGKRFVAGGKFIAIVSASSFLEVLL